MAIITTLSTREVARMLLDDTYANWSYDGAYALACWLEEMSEEEQLEFDRVALRCQFSEYSSVEDIESDFGDDWEERLVAADDETYWIVDCEM